MTGSFLSPDRVLAELGVEEPDDIDIEAIAQYCGATIIYEALEGAAARIVGYGDRAYITVDSRSSRPRQRFSAGHELGHWMSDRGRISAFECTEGNFTGAWSANNPETRANRFAGDLLLPKAMFSRDARAKEVTFAGAGALADRYETSLTATAIRLVELGSFPAVILCFEPGSKRWAWHKRGPDLPSRLWPRDLPAKNSIAFDIMNGGHPPSPANVGGLRRLDPRRRAYPYSAVVEG
jgi:Zn-dependent peptidase ImmA (M78 family)